MQVLLCRRRIHYARHALFRNAGHRENTNGKAAHPGQHHRYVAENAADAETLAGKSQWLSRWCINLPAVQNRTCSTSGSCYRRASLNNKPLPGNGPIFSGHLQQVHAGRILRAIQLDIPGYQRSFFLPDHFPAVVKHTDHR